MRGCLGCAVWALTFPLFPVAFAWPSLVWRQQPYAATAAWWAVLMLALLAMRARTRTAWS